MLKILRKLYGRSTKAEEQLATGGLDESRAQTGGQEQLSDLYDEFCATFCFRPGENLMDHLRAHGHSHLIDWLRWDTSEPEPKALIRLLVQSTREGRRPWEMHGLTFVRQGDDGLAAGAPSEATQKALSTLAAIMNQPILLGYKETPEGQWMTFEFKP